ncbi:MAG: YciI family protein [Saprospiraceae bacterium]
MTEFLMIFRNDETTIDNRNAEQNQTAMQAWQKWIMDMAQTGTFAGTNRLAPEGKLLKPNNVITDGPFMEGKEMVGGYLLINANSLAEATEIAKGCPGLTYGGTVEVRSVIPMDARQTADNAQSAKSK